MLLVPSVSHAAVNWKTSAAGFLLAVVVAAPIIGNTDWSHPSVNSVCGVLAALAVAWLGLLGVDNPSTPAQAQANAEMQKKVGGLLIVCGLGLMGFGLTCLLTGCASLPEFLQDFTKLVPMYAASMGAILTAIGKMVTSTTADSALAAAQTALNTYANKALQAFQNLEAVVNEYNQEQSADGKATLLGKIEDGTQAVIDNLNPLLGDFGVPPTIIAPIAGFAQLLISEVEAWSSIIPTLKAAQTAGATAAKPITIPMSAKQFQAAHNSLVKNAKTGVPHIDAALAEHLKPIVA